MNRIDDFKGCCDNGCVIKRPKGMGTNAKCRCPDYKLRAFIHALKTEIDRQSPVVEAAKAYRAEVKEGQEALHDCKKDGYAIAQKIRLLGCMLDQALSDMEGKEKR